MMTPKSWLRVALVLLAIAAVVVVGGCRTVPTFFSKRTTRPAARQPAHTATPSPSADRSRQAIQVVTDYLQALEARNYAAAYRMLSGDSQSTHTREDFEQQGKQGMPSFDFATARVTVTGDHAVVVMQQVEDPATHGFNLVREGGAWKIVYRGGIPGQPYAE